MQVQDRALPGDQRVEGSSEGAVRSNFDRTVGLELGQKATTPVVQGTEEDRRGGLEIGRDGPRPRHEELHRRGTGERGQIEEVPLGGAFAKLEEAVERGRLIALVVDRDVKGTGLKTEFFGEATTVPTGHARLALRTGAWILPVTTYRARDHRIIIDIREPIIPDASVDTEESLVVRCLRVLEEFIRAHPDQWSSFFDLWSRTELPIWQRLMDNRRKR